MKRRLLTFVFLLTSMVSFAAAIDFTAKVSSNVVEVGQRFQITFTVNSSGGSFTPPSFPKMRTLSGPNQSSSMQYVNGNMSRSTSISYILVATEEGQYNIGPASIKVDGDVYKTMPISITVKKASANSSNAQRNRQNQRNNDGQQLSDYVFVRARVDKTSAYVGEKVTVTYKLYSELTLSGLDLESPPSFNGFWTQDIVSLYDQIQLSREQIDGKVYNVAELQQTLLYPQRSGDLTIDPMSVKVRVQVKSRRARSIFEQMFGSYENKEIIAKSKPITLKVKPLPTAGKPADFSGAVGKFNMKMSSNKDSTEANEAIDIKVEINGTGNLPLISAPDLNFPPDFEVYDPETKDNFKTSYNGASGKKTFNYLVIPRHSGSFKLKPFSFSYFDLNSGTYKTIKAEPIQIEVAKGAEEDNVVYSSSRKEDIELLNTDIRHIHLNNVSLITASDLFYNSGLFYGLLLVALILVIAVYFIAKRFKIQAADKVGVRKSKAKKLAKKRLATAKKHLDANDKRSFYEEISAALYGYFSDKFNITVAEFSQEKIIELLSANEATTEIRKEVKTVLEEAEMARFAPDSGINPKVLYDRSEEIISKMEGLTS